MSIDELRLECLKLAQAERDREDVLARARAYADFVLGTRDAEIINAARELAKKLAA